MSYLRKVLATVGQTMEEPIRFTSALDAFVDKPPMQVLVSAELDWVLTGSAFPMGWGVRLRQAVYDSLAKDDIAPTLPNAIRRICKGETKIPGIGPKRIKAMREWCGWNDADQFCAECYTGRNQ